MNKVVFSGVFDPVTIGHLNFIERAAQIFPEVVVAVAEYSAKNPFWSIAQRTQMLQAAIEHIANVKVRSFSGLLVDFMKAQEANTIIRGVRSVVDWSYEIEMAAINKRLMPAVETIFLPSEENISSSFVRQIYALRGDISTLVPPNTLELINKFNL